jgi:hypothetical protein
MTIDEDASEEEEEVEEPEPKSKGLASRGVISIVCVTGAGAAEEEGKEEGKEIALDFVSGDGDSDRGAAFESVVETFVLLLLLLLLFVTTVVVVEGVALLEVFGRDPPCVGFFSFVSSLLTTTTRGSG